jgi:hypothetical protein
VTAMEAVQKRWFSNDFRLLRDGTVVAELDVAALRTRADLDVDGDRYRFYRDGALSGTYLMERAGHVLVRAEKPGMLRGRFTIHIRDRAYELRKQSAWGRTFVLHEDGAEVGTLRRRGFVIRRIQLDLPADWPLSVQAFIFWLALIVWRREDAAAVGS